MSSINETIALTGEVYFRLLNSKNLKIDLSFTLCLLLCPIQVLYRKKTGPNVLLGLDFYFVFVFSILVAK